MSHKLLTIVLAAAVAAGLAGCERVDATRIDSGRFTSPEAARRNELRNRYQFAPREEVFENPQLLKELRGRYRNNLAELKKSVETNRSKLVVMYLSPEFGGKMYVENEPFINDSCRELGIEYVDFTKTLAGKDPKSFTQLPKDGHFSKAGAELIALEIEKIVSRYGDLRSDVTFPEGDRPKTFGDFDPGSDEIKGTEKDLPYRLKVNSQGLRMDSDLSFPKTRQRILFLGDSQMYFPYLDNQATAPALLQAKFPDKEYLNAATFGYSIDDYLSLYDEKARFAEPDLVIVATNGGDITDMYFSHRNIYSRSERPFEPTPTELEFYPMITAR